MGVVMKSQYLRTLIYLFFVIVSITSQRLEASAALSAKPEQSASSSSGRSGLGKPDLRTEMATSELARIDGEMRSINIRLAGLEEIAISAEERSRLNASIKRIGEEYSTACNGDASVQAAYDLQVGQLLAELGNYSGRLAEVYQWDLAEISKYCTPEGRVLITGMEPEASRMFTAIDSFNKTMPQERSKFEERLKDLKSKREAVLTDMAQGLAAAKVSSNLPWLLLIISGIGGAILLGIRFFSQEIQQELVSSGQILQFVTILILLAVILALGLAEKLNGETLGTLLGGLAGYVLSQGVGRQERQRMTEALKAVQNSAPGVVDGKPTAPVAQ